MGLTTHASVEEYFHEVVQQALERVYVDATVGAECYLVGLLGRFATTRLTDEPLSLKLVRAHADPAERVRALGEVADTSLYVAGFFAESLQRTLVSAEYYMNLGEAAYRELAHRLSGPRSTSSAIAEIYQELAAEFPLFVDVLAEVRREVDFASGDVAALYQQWLETRDDWVERKLRALGVLVGDSGSGYLQ